MNLSTMMMCISFHHGYNFLTPSNNILLNIFKNWFRLSSTIIHFWWMGEPSYGSWGQVWTRTNKTNEHLHRRLVCGPDTRRTLEKRSQLSKKPPGTVESTTHSDRIQWIVLYVCF